MSRAQSKARAAIERRCSKVQPSQINGPCARGAAGFGATANCLLAQHGAQVAKMVEAEFSVTRPVPLTGEARVCQTAIAKNGRRLANRLHPELGRCIEKLLMAADAGKGEAKAIAGCRTTLDLGNPSSKATRARDAGLLDIVRSCTGRNPAGLGSPCDPAAPTMTSIASCVLDGDVAGVAKLIAGEFNDACVMLTRVGVAGGFPAVCSGS